MTKNKVIRIQGDRLCKYLGYPPGTKIELNEIKMIAECNVGDTITINEQPVKVEMYMKGIAMILLEKICS